jgi:WhiB family redox-sensing transcriptional regulator
MPPRREKTPTITGTNSFEWMEQALCLDEDPELFFPLGNTGLALLQIEEAKSVCRKCDVRDVCLQWALEAGQDFGVWGGLSEDERRALKLRAGRTGRIALGTRQA